MEKYFRIAAGIIGFILVLLSVIGMNAELADSDSVETMLPPCELDEGTLLPGDEELICYWGMSVEVLEIPSEAIAADVIVDISWDNQDVWIGIAEADQISNCDLDESGEYYRCDKDSVTLIEGGQNSNGQINWSPEPGEYRFVAGGEDSESLQQFSVNWEYEAMLKGGVAIPLLLIGTALVFYSIFRKILF